MKEIIHRALRTIRGNDLFTISDTRVNATRIGSDYGGWWIKDNLTSDDVVLSFGLGEDVTFDLGLIEKYNCKVFGFDPTPKSLNYLDTLNLPKNLSIYNYGLGSKDETVEFYLPENPKHVSGTIFSSDKKNKIIVPLKSLNTICHDLDIQKIKVLKMDIEGAEYSVLESILDDKTIEVEQILIEYHHFFEKVSTEDTKTSIQLMRDNGYKLFKIEHYNYSFIKQ